VIRGLFEERFGTSLPVAWTGLVLPHRSMGYAAIDFVVDTAAAASALHPLAARRRLAFTDADFVMLPRITRGPTSLTGISGSAAYFAVPARYVLARDDGTAHLIDGEIRIAEPIPANEEIPSVLGWDILRHFRILLDQRTGEVLLDEEPPSRRPR
jgi:hypothetical protein